MKVRNSFIQTNLNKYQSIQTRVLSIFSEVIGRYKMQNNQMLNHIMDCIDSQKEPIIDRWMADNALSALFAKYEVSKEYFAKHIDVVIESAAIAA